MVSAWRERLEAHRAAGRSLAGSSALGHASPPCLTALRSTALGDVCEVAVRPVTTGIRLPLIQLDRDDGKAAPPLAEAVPLTERSLDQLFELVAAEVCPPPVGADVNIASVAHVSDAFIHGRNGSASLDVRSRGRRAGFDGEPAFLPPSINQRVPRDACPSGGSFP